MQENQMRATSLDSVAAEQQRFMVRVYNWMGAGLGITGVMAFYIANTPAIFNVIMGNPIMPIVLIIAQIGLVFWLASRVMSMSVSQATGIFMLYAGLTGITFSTLFVVYTAASITSMSSLIHRPCWQPLGKAPGRIYGAACLACETNYKIMFLLVF